jgi:hypothetical protein
MITRSMHTVASEERGGVLLITSIALAALVFVVALVIDVANWKEHSRHLQLQADAAALAGAHSLLAGGCSDTLIANDTRRYAGSDVDGAGTVRTALYNDQVGGTPASNMHVLINSAAYYGTAGAGDNTDPNGSPCAAKYVDVKITETNLPWFFLGSFVGKLNAHARVSLLQETSSNGTLPIAVPNPVPTSAAAIFVNEGATAADGSKQILATAALTDIGLSGANEMFQSSAVTPVSVTIPSSGSVGVVIALSGRQSLSLSGTLTAICQQQLTDCYDASNDPPVQGLSFIRGYSVSGSGTAPNPPIIRSAELLPTAGSCGTGGSGVSPYFSDGTCNYKIVARIDAGASFPKANQVYGANGVTMDASTDPDCAILAGSDQCWHANLSVPGNTGPQPIDITWEITSGQRQIGGKLEDCKSGGGNKCTGDFGVVQRAFSAKDTRSGPIKIVKLYRCDGDPACAVSDMQSYETGSTHTFIVALGIGGSLRNATGVGDPLVVLRIKSNTGQSLDCDPGYTNLKDEMQFGCRPTYVPNTGTPDCSTLGTSALWASNKPWSCIAVNTGRSPNDISGGLNGRLYNGDRSPSTCAADGTNGHNNWFMFNPNYTPTGPADPRGQDGFPVGDPRVLNAYITTYGAFSHVNGTSGSVPVIGFGHFYVTGYTGNGGGFNNPCYPAPPSNYSGLHPDDRTPNDDTGLIVGHFIRFVDTVGGDGTVTCDPSSIFACVTVMTK